MQQPDSRDQPDCEVKVHPCKAEEESNSHKDSNKDEESDLKETNSDLVRH